MTAKSHTVANKTEFREYRQDDGCLYWWLVNDGDVVKGIVTADPHVGCGQAGRAGDSGGCGAKA